MGDEPSNIDSFEAEAGDDCPTCHCSHENLSLDDREPVYFDGEIAWVDINCDDCGMSANASTYEFEFEDDGSLKDVGLPIAVDMTNPNYGELRCTNCHEPIRKNLLNNLLYL